jgi:hypothetical protein
MTLAAASVIIIIYYMARICFNESRNLISLLTRQDFPVLPTGNTQLLLPCDESRVSNGKKYLKVFQTIQNEEK